MSFSSCLCMTGEGPGSAPLWGRSIRGAEQDERAERAHRELDARQEEQRDKPSAQPAGLAGHAGSPIT